MGSIETAPVDQSFEATSEAEEADDDNVEDKYTLYQNAESLLRLLRQPTEGLPPVRLLKCEWLVERASKARGADSKARQLLALPRRQELELTAPDAFYLADEVESMEESMDGLCVISVSYCWEGADHPDPNCSILLDVADAIVAAQTEPVRRADGAVYWPLPKEAAIFLDWCSLCQKDEHGKRTSEENVAFGVALGCMQVWYAHTSTTSLLMTKPATAGRSYMQRGWPVFERSVSLLGKTSASDCGPPLIIDAGREGGVAERPMALTPSLFRSALDSVAFTNQADADVVAELYSQTAKVLYKSADRLEYPGLDWADDDIRQLCSWLPMCTKLRFLRLDGHPRVGDEGLMSLSHTFRRTGMLPNLEDLFLGHVSRSMSGSEERVLAAISDAGLNALTEAIEAGALPSLGSLYIIGKTKASKKAKKALIAAAEKRSIRCDVD